MIFNHAHKDSRVLLAYTGIAALAVLYGRLLRNLGAGEAVLLMLLLTLIAGTLIRRRPAHPETKEE